jgi:hypothetical protein
MATLPRVSKIFSWTSSDFGAVPGARTFRPLDLAHWGFPRVIPAGSESFAPHRLAHLGAQAQCVGEVGCGGGRSKLVRAFTFRA